VIRPGDPGDGLEGRDPLHREVARRHEAAEEVAHQAAGAHVAHHRQEVPRRRVEPLEGERIGLRARRPAVVAEGLQRQHPPDKLAAPARPAGVEAAAHVVAGEVGHLLVHEGDVAQGAGARRAGQRRGQLQEDRHAAGVVVRARRAGRGIVVCAHEENARAGVGPRLLRHHVGHELPAHRVGLLPHREALAPPRLPDVARRRPQGLRPPQVSLADAAGEGLHVPPQALLQIRYARRRAGPRHARLHVDHDEVGRGRREDHRGQERERHEEVAGHRRAEVRARGSGGVIAASRARQ